MCATIQTSTKHQKLTLLGKPYSLLKRQQQQQPPKKKRVCFGADIASVIGHTICRSDMTAVEVAQCWWSREEQKQIRIEARTELRSMTKKVPSIVRQLELNCEGIRSVCRNVADPSEAAQEMIQNPEIYAQHIQNWVQHSSCQEGRGLERWVSKKMASSTQANNLSLRNTILDMLNQISDISLQCDKRDSLLEEVAIFYSKKASAATVLARLFAIADEQQQETSRSTLV